MKERKYMLFVFILTFLIIILMPIFLNVGHEISNYFGYKIGSNDGWLGFYGSFFGVIVATITFLNTVDSNKRKTRLSDAQNDHKNLIWLKQEVIKNGRDCSQRIWNFSKNPQNIVVNVDDITFINKTLVSWIDVFNNYNFSSEIITVFKFKWDKLKIKNEIEHINSKFILQGRYEVYTWHDCAKFVDDMNKLTNEISKIIDEVSDITLMNETRLKRYF